MMGRSLGRPAREGDPLRAFLVELPQSCDRLSREEADELVLVVDEESGGGG